MKDNIATINKNEYFREIVKKVTIGESLKDKEKEYILAVALIFLKYYNRDKKFRSYLEFAYYIILKYSITYEDYKPLYDFSVEFGFFPIAKAILEHELIPNLKINDILVELEIEKFKQDDYMQTLEQFNTYNAIMKSKDSELAFIAPTSYGKSSIIVDLIKKHDTDNIKIAIIVPTKSLVTQTFILLKNQKLNKRLLLHDEMFNNDKGFIAIFTQERALRLLLNNRNIYFDILFIDEAHNLFEKDMRNILLSRLIKRNLSRNKQTNIFYLSPLIQDVENLKLDKNQSIQKQKIDFNMKELEIYHYTLSSEIKKYNRFTNKFYQIEYECLNFFKYIENKSLKKNFIYLRRPKQVEEFALELADELPNIEDEDIHTVINIINDTVHKDFYIAKTLSKGIIYLHGKLPEIIKEYLEYKFKNNSKLRYVIANSVILEGINLPIDTMFILDTYCLTQKDLINLTGRVNRLNEVFTKENNIHKLLPQIHFIDTELYNNKKGKMENKIRLFKTNLFKDKVRNPILESCAEKEKQEEKTIIENENFLIEESIDNEYNRLKKYFIENNINMFYRKEYLDQIINIINTKINTKRYNTDIFEKIYILFIKDIESYISDYEFDRLKFEEARRYYSTYIKNTHKYTFKENINYLYEYFKGRQQSENIKFYYVGESYGEITKASERYPQNTKKVYVDLTKKSDIELINLAIVKLQMEENFISYKINRLIEMMYHFEYITEEEYNSYIYGTKDSDKLYLMKLGFRPFLIKKIKRR